MIKNMVKQYLEDGTVPAYHYIGITYDRDQKGNLKEDGKGGYKWSYDAKNYTNAGKPGNIHYVLKALTDTSDSAGGKDFSTINPRWYTTTSAGYGYDSFIVDKASTITVDEYLAYVKKSAPGNWKTKYNALTLDAIRSDTTKMATLKADIAELIAHNWFLAEQIAENGTSGGAEVRDSYLATITTRLENSLSTPNGQHTLWVGGRGSGVRGRTVNDDPNNPATWGPSDPTLMDGFYWVTGPEGADSTYKDSKGNTLKYDAGTKFWDTVSSDWKTGKNGEKAYGLDPTWSTYKSGGKIITQPDNNGPFLTVGFGSDNQWDDANFGGETTWGFVQETNLANSSLKINTGKGSVALKGDIGKGQALDTLSIDGGTVKIGDTSNKVTDYNHGTVYVDHGLKITGTGNVTVGGEIHSGENPETDTSTTLEDTYKDNVTILSSGNIEVHGITSNTYDDGTTTTRGGKISLTSTGTEGVITLGDGVDYSGNATDGTLAAASAEQGAVVIDAQGSQGSLVNNTKGTDAITTGKDVTTGKYGTWQVYSASPDNNTFGTNLNSGTDAQWTSKSASNTIATENKYGKTPNGYSDTSSNKFIFQATPVITLYTDDYLKIYGDEVSADTLNKLLKGKEVFTGLDGKSHNVNDYSSAFQEDGYTKYISGEDTVTVTSDGSTATATRTGGKYEATDKQKAIYDLNVNLNGAEALDGYALNKENAKLEIKRKPLTINTNISQTYGNDTPTLVTPSDYQNQLVGKDTLSADDITYTISSTGKYAPSKGTSGTTAHVGTYAGEYLTTGAKVKDGNGNDASANYEVSGSGTITVNPADLVLQLKDVSTTYGQKFDETTYGYNQDTDYLKGLLKNGDDASVITDNIKNDAIHYVNTGAVTDTDKNRQGIYTADAGKDYTISSNDTVSLQDYNVTFASGNSTVNKAKLSLTVGDTSTTYGSDAWTPYTYTLTGNANGDTVDSVKGNGITAVYTNTGAVTDAASNEKKIYTKDADGKYQLLGDFTLTGQTAKNYEIATNTPGKATVNKATVKVKLNDVSTTYGTAFDTDKYGYDPSKIEGLTNGDKTDVVTQVLNGDYKTGNIQYTNTGDASAEEKLDGKVTKTVNGGPYYLQGTTSQTLGNYNIEIEDGNATINKATLHLSTGDYKETYGDVGEVQKDLDSATRVTGGEANGDKLSDLITKITITDTSDALISKDRTNDVGKYLINTKVTNPLDNYDVVQDNEGFITLTPKDIYTEVNGKGSTLNDLTWTVMQDPKDQMVNGDSVKFTYTPGNLISYDNQTFDVNSFINGTQTFDSTTDILPYGKNYIFHSTGKIQLTFNPIVKPDVWAHSGGYRPRNKIETFLPVFRVEDAKVGQYGTYGVEHNEEGDRLVLSATGMRLPEPDQVPDEERTFTTTLSTETGSGTFKLVYNGVSLKVYPQDKEAEETVRAGDKTKNVSLSEKALYVGYTEMGLDLIDLKGVYIYFN